LKIPGKSYVKSSKALFAAQSRVNKMDKATKSAYLICGRKISLFGFKNAFGSDSTTDQAAILLTMA
jgi:hypothetical protein